MAISTTRGTQITDGSPGSFVTYTQSTATAAQTLSSNVGLHSLGGGTASGNIRNNKYLLPTSGMVEGQSTIAQMSATGFASLHFTGTATGALVFQSDGDLVELKLLNGTWFQRQLVGATLATATE